MSPASKAILGGAAAPPAKVRRNHFDTIVRGRSRLDVVPLTTTEARKHLEQLGARYGLSTGEVLKGADRLVGWCVRRIGEEHGAGAALTAGDLIEQLVGFPDARPLERGELAASLPAEIDEAYALAVRGPLLADVFPRAALASIWAGSEPVIVTGQGGVGKTSAVLRALRDHVAARREVGLSLYSTSSDDACAAVARWRNVPPALGHERFDASLARLAAANAGHVGNLLVVVLDGVEERGWRDHTSRRAQVAQLLALARGARPAAAGMSAVPQVKVVVTCRSESDLAGLIADAGIDGPPAATRQRVVSLGGFEDDGEFELAWLAWCPHLPLPAFLRPLGGRRLLDRADDDAALDGASTARRSLLAVLLRVPAMLRCFRTLGAGEAGPAVQQALLRGDDAALDAMLSVYVAWFVEKSSLRGGLKAELAFDGLRCVASATAVAQQYYLLHDHWSEPIRHYVGAGPEPARQLFDDAVSSGIVERLDGGRSASRTYGVHAGLPWRWRFEAVRAHLASRLASAEDGPNVDDEPEAT